MNGFNGHGTIQRKGLDYPVKSDADLREESLRPDNDNIGTQFAANNLEGTMIWS
jgi:hypothetical protein